jgi:hypothetical protein
MTPPEAIGIAGTLYLCPTRVRIVAGRFDIEHPRQRVRGAGSIRADHRAALVRRWRAYSSTTDGMSLGWNVWRSMSGPIGTLMGFGVISSGLMRHRSSILFQGASCRSGPRVRKVSARRAGLELVRGRVRERTFNCTCFVPDTQVSSDSRDSSD